MTRVAFALPGAVLGAYLLAILASGIAQTDEPTQACSAEDAAKSDSMLQKRAERVSRLATEELTELQTAEELLSAFNKTLQEQREEDKREIAAMRQQLTEEQQELKAERLRAAQRGQELQENQPQLLQRKPEAPAGKEAAASESFELCRAPSPRSLSSLSVAARRQKLSSNDTALSVKSWCGPKYNTLFSTQDTPPYFSKECCPVEEAFCAGCATMNAEKTACDTCQGGFSKGASGMCEPCIDHPGWHDGTGKNCYTASCSDDKYQGFSSNDACCKCSGGQREANKFIYYVGAFALGSKASEVVGFPIPRTASRYSVDKDCELAKYGLTVEPSDGTLKLLTGCSSVGCGALKPFVVSCTITAEQGHGLTASTSLAMAISFVTYGSGAVPLLLLDGDKVAPSTTYPYEYFHDFACSPDADSWLTMEESSGTIFMGKPPKCPTFTCKTGYMLKLTAAAIVGSSNFKCCDPICSVHYKCPVKYIMKAKAAEIGGNDTKTCCDKACSGYECPVDTLSILQPALTAGNDEETCCVPACSAFTCDTHYTLKPEASKIRGSSNAVCCVEACSGFTCAPDYLQLVGAETVRGNTAEVCCVKACSQYTCNDKYILKPSPAEIRGETREVCCESAGDDGVVANIYDFDSWEKFPFKWQDCKIGEGEYMGKYTPTETKTDLSINYDCSSCFKISNGRYFAIIWTGLLRVGTPGPYSFKIDSDDGAKMWLNLTQGEPRTEIFDNSGWCRTGHRRRRNGNIKEKADVELEKGITPFTMLYFQKSMDGNCNLYYKGADTGGEYKVMDQTVLFHRTETTDLTAPPDPEESTLQIAAPGGDDAEVHEHETPEDDLPVAREASDPGLLEEKDNDEIQEDAVVTGGITGFAGMTSPRGGSCSVRVGGNKFEMLILAPTAWATMSYAGVDSVYASLGEAAPTATIQGAATGLAPTRFSAYCPGQNFAFDTITGTATWDGYMLFSLDVKDGSFRLEPEAGLAASLDTLAATAIRRVLPLTCTVFGHYEWPPVGRGPVIQTEITMEIRDDTCWSSRTLSFHNRVHKTDAGSEGACRASCRKSKTCSHYSFSGSCDFFSAVCKDKADSTCLYKDKGVYERYPGCGERHSCVKLSLPGLYWLSGTFCPGGENTYGPGAGPVYLKQGLTKQESFWLQRYVKAKHDAEFCHVGDWMIRKVAPEMDYENTSMVYTELHGDIVACVGFAGSSASDLASEIFGNAKVDLQVRMKTPTAASHASATVATPGCITPNITAQDEEEEEEEGVKVDVIQLDDPSTSTVLDHWLHPCDCAPHVWGPNAPVSSETSVEVPAGSGNKYKPGAFQIVTGGMVCEQSSLIRVIFESETETMDEGACKAYCLQDSSCAFFWDGEVASTKQCRLYRSCSTLVREVGVSGSLYAQIREDVCRVADPDGCWKTTKRRSFLGAGQDTWACLHQDLLEQCDQKLMLGGLGIEACARCTYASWQSGANWRGKTRLPTAFVSGQSLTASCWDERFKNSDENTETLTCLAGSWVNSKGKGGLGDFACAACVQVVSDKYKDFDMQEKQELFFFGAMKVKLLVDSRTRLQVGSNGALTTSAADEFAAELVSDGPETARRFRSLGSTNVCLQAASSTLGHGTCSASEKQLLEPVMFSSLLWDSYKSNVQIPAPVSQALLNTGSGPVTMRSFAVNVDCGDHAVGRIGFRHGDQVGMSGSCTPAVSFGDKTTTRVTVSGGDKIINEKYGTCMSLKLNLPFVLKATVGGVDRCADYDPGSDNVYMHTCHGGTNQKWLLVGKMIKTVHGGKCLDASKSDDNIYMHASCHGATNQQWDYDDDTKNLMPLHNSECMTIVNKSNTFNLEHHTCSKDSALQQFKVYQETANGEMYPQHYDCTDDESSQLALVVTSSTKFTITSDASTSIAGARYDKTGGLLKVAAGTIPGKGGSGSRCLAATEAGPLDEVKCDKDKVEQQWVIGNGLKRWADVPVSCPPGQLISHFEKGAGHVAWGCSHVASLGGCAPGQTPQVNTQGKLRAKEGLKEMAIACEEGKGLQSFEPEASEKGEWLRFRYTCCSISQVPTAIVPSRDNPLSPRPKATFLPNFVESWQGMYCPAAMGEDGRVSFRQAKSFKPGAYSPETLTYRKETGEWCLSGAQGSCAQNDMVHPLDGALGAGGWKVAAVSNFDGKFEGKGVKKPKRKSKKPPPLIKFGAPEPKYAPECKDESHPGSKKFDLKKMNKEAQGLNDENPCKYVYGKAPTKVDYGSSGPSNNGDGMSWWEDDLAGESAPGQGGVTYKSVQGCFARESARDWVQAKRDFSYDVISSSFSFINDLIELHANFFPLNAVEPFGLGITFDTPEAYGGVAHAIMGGLQTVADVAYAAGNKRAAAVGGGDCDSSQFSMARMFCDLHCIRDAVRQGDAAILDGLEGAVEVIGKNTQLLLEHYVGDLKPEDNSLLEEREAIHGLRASLAETMSIAREAALEPRASSAIQRAVNRFSAKWQGLSLVGAEGNRSAHISAMSEDAQRLRTMLAMASKERVSQADEMRLSTVQYAGVMNQYLQERSHLLGMYQNGAKRGRLYQRWLRSKWHPEESSEVLAELKDESISRILHSMDSIWWRLRSEFDNYLDASQEQVGAMKSAVALLESYTSHCSAGFHSLKGAWTSTVRAERQAHDALKKAWTAAVPLLGLLASDVTDGEIMGHLAAADASGLDVKAAVAGPRNSSCAGAVEVALRQAMEQGLWGQTRRQVHVAFGEMAMLESRFEAGNLGPAPETDSVREAEGRVVQALQASWESVPELATALIDKHSPC